MNPDTATAEAYHAKMLTASPPWDHRFHVVDPEMQAAYNAAMWYYDRDQERALVDRYGTATPRHVNYRDNPMSKSSALCDALTLQPSHRVEGFSEDVLQRAYVPTPYRPFESSTPVRFRANGHDGINLDSAFKSNFAGLERRDEPAFSLMNTKLSFRLEWFSPSGEAYPPYTHQITIRDSTKEAKSITVAKLARTMAKELKRFIEVSKSFQFDDPAWRVGPGFIELDQIELISLRQVSEGSVQADLRVIRR